MSDAPFAVRPRRPDDVPDLCTLLAEQQPTYRYPFRWPLPFPVEDFVVRDREICSWVAEDDGGILGHVALLTGLGADHAATFAGVVDVPPEKQGVVSVLFVSLRARRRGVGRHLLGHAVQRCRELGLTPVLDVVPAHRAAMDLYRAEGWQVVAEERASWLPDEAPDLILMTLPDDATGSHPPVDRSA